MTGHLLDRLQLACGADDHGYLLDDWVVPDQRHNAVRDPRVKAVQVGLEIAVDRRVELA